MKTLDQLAQEAINVQDACNLTAVAHGFSRAMAQLREMFPDKGTDFYNTHPVTVVWVDKLASLCGIQDLLNGNAMEAHRVISDLAHRP